LNIQDPTFEDADSNSEKAVFSSKSLQNIQCSDVGLWSHLSKTDVDYWIKKGPSDYQHRNRPFKKSKREYSQMLLDSALKIFFTK